MPTILANDSTLALPDFTLVSASAGSGKTHTLTLRALQLLLSERIRPNDLQNILAATFTNNAALEMKQRIVGYLKEAAFGNEKTLAQLREIVSLGPEKLQARAGSIVEIIFDRYSDFQVQTIDSFLTRVLKVSALEFGLPPQFDLVLDSDALLDEAFSHFAQRLATDKDQRGLFEALIGLVNENRTGKQKFLWNPFDAVAKEVKNLYRQLALHSSEPSQNDTGPAFRRVEEELLRTIREIGQVARRSGFEISKNYMKILDDAEAGNVHAFVGKSLGQSVLKKSKEAAQVTKQLETLQEHATSLIPAYFLASAQQYYRPYLQAHLLLLNSIDAIKQLRSRIDLGDANRMLATSLQRQHVPEIYYSLGERINHFLVDEFQDTNPIQWKVMRPLIEESLSKQGSLFLVGDMKQAIYSFRGGDWQIMKRLITGEESFPSAPCNNLSLPHNHRSAETIVDFTKEVFHTIVPQQVGEEIAELSGLRSFEQEVLPAAKGKGYVELQFFELPEDEPDIPPERKKLIDVINGCKARGYAYRDIAILTPQNNHVVIVSEWLNEEGIRFLSHSSLDIRTRTITGEIIALLKFLDSPIDDLSFATVLLSRLLHGKGKGVEEMRGFLFHHRKTGGPSRTLYTAFRAAYPELWEQRLEHLFNIVGYMPVYDLIAEMYKQFRVFDVFPEEEAALVKLLEVIREFETTGLNNLKDFLSHAEEDSADAKWDIAVAPGEDAVTVMTVHKAKGLGFPVVIALLYDGVPRPENMFMEEHDETIELLRITKTSAEKSPELATIYNKHKELQLVDELNKLYVALTRAEQELYVLSIKATRGDSPSRYFPPDGSARGMQKPPSKKDRPGQREIGLSHPYTRGLKQAAEVYRIGLEETKRGDFIHAILAQIEYAEPSLEPQIENAIQALQHDARTSFDLPSIKKRILTLLGNEGLVLCFTQKDGRRVLNEQDVTTAAGELYRIDRLVVDQDGVTVIDYKTGKENPAYRTQVGHYMKIAQNLYPDRPVRGYLAYIDLNLVTEIFP
ncbi:MAG: UvrD-helicase domain-containing protein [Ignavibacteriales bacterium]|nr:UvrD-helicase domain-containing protein [Ignavibacteriales bacterium]